MTKPALRAYMAAAQGAKRRDSWEFGIAPNPSYCAESLGQ